MSGQPTSAGFLPTDPPLVVDKSHAGSGFGVAHESPVRGSWSARSAHTFGGNACNLMMGMFALRPAARHYVKPYFPAEFES